MCHINEGGEFNSWQNAWTVQVFCNGKLLPLRPSCLCIILCITIHLHFSIIHVLCVSITTHLVVHEEKVDSLGVAKIDVDTIPKKRLSIQTESEVAPKSRLEVKQLPGCEVVSKPGCKQSVDPVAFPASSRCVSVDWIPSTTRMVRSLMECSGRLKCTPTGFSARLCQMSDRWPLRRM